MVLMTLRVSGDCRHGQAAAGSLIKQDIYILCFRIIL